MKRGKTIFLVIYLVFHLIFLVAAIVVNLRSEDFEFLFSVRDNMQLTVWFAAAGLLLFIINVVLISSSTRHHEKKEEGLRNEINSLKAKIYDLQDAKSTATPAPTPKPISPEGTDSTKSPEDTK